MNPLQEHAINVFVVDRNGKPIPGAKVRALYNSTDIGGGTSRGIDNVPTRLQLAAAYDHITLQVTYRAHVKTADVNSDVGNFTFTMEEVVIPSHGSPGPTTASWIFGGILLIFLVLTLWFHPQQTFGAQQQKVLGILVSVFVGLISAFFTGSLNLGGTLPRLSDIQIKAAGGFAGFALALLIWFYV